MSIKNYTEATAATAGTFADVETRVASWWAPRPIETYMDRRRGRQRPQLDDADDFDIVPPEGEIGCSGGPYCAPRCEAH